MKKILIILCAVFICGAAIAQTIRWHIGDTVYQTTTCNAGESITPPTAPEKFGYSFSEWVEYIPIEYLESTGTQYIDTGVTTFPVKYNLKIQLTDPTRNQAILGTLKVNVSTGNDYEYQIGTASNKFYLVNTEPVFSDINSTSDLYNITGTINEVGTVRVGDVGNPSQSTEMTKTALRNITPLRPIYVLNRYSSSAAQYATTGRLYSVQFYDIHNILVRDFIPVLDKNGTPCMYDKVENKFYYNAGTGQFIAGPVIGGE